MKIPTPLNLDAKGFPGGLSRDLRLSNGEMTQFGFILSE
jgi:hypothetical protein